jgi:hypothetical protein
VRPLQPLRASVLAYAPSPPLCAPLHLRAFFLYLSVRPPHKSMRPPLKMCALPSLVYAPPGCRVHLTQACVSYPAGMCALPACMRAPQQPCAPLHVGVCILPPQACAPSPESLPPCAPPRRRAHPAPTNVLAFVAGGRTRYIRKGPSYPHFTTLGFVS